MTSPEKLATPDSVMERLSEIEHSLWILREHQTLHFGDAHNTTMEATKAHLSVIALRAEVTRLPTASGEEGRAIMSEVQYLIASLTRTIKDHEHITFWAPDRCGYRLAITDSRVGKYTAAEVEQYRLNDGESTLAVPMGEVLLLLSPEPYWQSRNGPARFYDTPGPVVDNTRANWNRLIAAALPLPAGVKPKPEVFRRKRRSFALEPKQ